MCVCVCMLGGFINFFVTYLGDGGGGRKIISGRTRGGGGGEGHNFL